MSYINLTESTTANAEDIMQNYYHIAQGDFMPLGGSNLAPTNSGTHLGNGSYYYNSLFCKTLDYNSIALTNTNHKFWTKIAEVTLSDTASSITINFPKGADCNANGTTIGSDIKIIMSGSHTYRTSGSEVMYVALNAGDYNHSYTRMWSKYYTATSVFTLSSVSAESTSSYVPISRTIYSLTNAEFSLQAILHVRSNYMKTFLSEHSTFDGAAQYSYCYGLCTVDTITGITISYAASTLLTNTNVQVWSR